MNTEQDAASHVYSFLDEATGLFWTGDLNKTDNVFAPKGIEYRTRKTAEEAFRVYEVTRLGAKFGQHLILPEIVMLVQKVQLLETAREKFASAADMVRLTRFCVIHGKNHKITGFVRGLMDRQQRDFMEFTHIVQREPQKRDRKMDRTGGDLDLSALNAAVLSSRKTARTYVAVRGEADLTYLRMALGENFVRAYSLETGVATDEKK